MKAAVYYENGPPSVFKYEDVADPVCAPDGILIKVEAVSIEGGDSLARAGGDLATRPHIVGYQAAGEVIEVGSNAADFKPGDKVVTVNMFGSHAELRAVPALSAWKVPDRLDLKKAAAMPVPFGTADDCLFEFGDLKAGETVLIQAGAGAVGLAAIQLAKRAGARVFATASSDEKLERLKRFGLDHGINYTTHDFAAEAKRLTDNQGVNLVVDPVGTTIQQDVAALAYRGRVSLVGRAGRGDTSVDVTTLMQGNMRINGVFLGAELLLNTNRVRETIGRHIASAAAGELEVVIDREFPLAEAAAAHDYIERRSAFGRVLLIP